MSSQAPSPTAPSSTRRPRRPVPTITHTGVDGRGILITEPAMRQLGTLMASQGGDKVLRVGVRSGGCSGMSYTMDFIEGSEILPDDETYTYEPDGAPSFRVVCDPKSLLYIYGMQLDFSSRADRRRLQFHQPQRLPDLRLRQLLRRLRSACPVAPGPVGVGI